MSPAPADDDEARRFAAAVFRAQLAEAFRRPTPMTWGLLLALTLIAAAQGAADHWLGASGLDRLVFAGALIPDKVLQGEWWRPLTGPMLHSTWSHLLMNLVGIGLIGRQIEAAYGSAGFAVLWLAATLAGALGTLLAGHAISVGASGGVFGLVSALVILGARLWPRLQARLRVSLVLVPAALLLLLLGVGELAELVQPSRLDRAAHAGGALGGMLAGGWLPLRLRDADGANLVAAPSPTTRRLVRWLALAGIFASLLAFAEFARRGQDAPRMPPVVAQVFATEIGPIKLPASQPRGVLREGRCEGERVSVDWAIGLGHRLCSPLPLGGLLLVGRRDKLLTLDAGDHEAMRDALRQGRFVRRERDVLLHPIGRDHLYVVLGNDALLPTYAEALAALLPVDATVVEATLPATPAATSSPMADAAPVPATQLATTPTGATP